MADVLAHLGGLRAEDLVSVPGVKRATFQSSLERLRTIMSQTPKGVRREVVIYYSGHSDENGLLLGGERLSYRELRQWLDAVDAEVRIAILDSCASGSLIRLRGGTHRQPFLSDLSTDTRGHAFLTASSANEAAQESDRIGAAFFTHYLVSGLRGAADANRDGRVTLAEAYQFAYSETMRRTEQTAAGAQHPAYDFQLAGTGDVVLTDLRSTNASLVLTENVAGRIYVRDATGRLLVELRKEPLYPVQLGLSPGTYRVALDADGVYSAASVVVEEGKTARLERAHFAAALAEPATRRGADDGATSAQGPTTTSTPAAQPPSSVADTPSREKVGVGTIKDVGGYVGAGMNYAQLGGTDGLLVDLEGAVLLNRRIALGLTAGGGASGHINPRGEFIALGYFGVVGRYFFRFDSALSVSIGASAAIGGASRERSDSPSTDDALSVKTALFQFEPQVGGHLDLTRFARLGVHAGYRLAAGAEDFGASNVRGLTAGLQFQLGWF